MEDLLRAVRSAQSSGEPLPGQFPELEEVGAVIRRGQLTMIAGGPGVGKSLLAETLLIRAQSKALYLSMDTQQKEALFRGAAMLSPDSPTLEQVERAYENDQFEEYHDLIRTFMRPNIWWYFDSGADLHQLSEEVQAFGMVFGEWPSAIVVDNMKNVYANSDPWENLSIVSDVLKDMAIQTNAAVIALHHLTGEHDNGLSIPDITTIRGKISKIPNQIWTLSTDTTRSTMRVHIVKNRNGQADPSGQRVQARLNIDYSKGLIS